MIKKMMLFFGLFFYACVSYAELKIGFVNVARVLEKAPQAEKAKKQLEKWRFFVTTMQRLGRL